jgi:hypothetical protein
MAGIGWAPLGGEWWTWQWCWAMAARWQPTLPPWAASCSSASAPPSRTLVSGPQGAAWHRCLPLPGFGEADPCLVALVHCFQAPWPAAAAWPAIALDDSAVAGRTPRLPRRWVEGCYNHTLGSLTALSYPALAVVQQTSRPSGLIFLSRGLEVAGAPCWLGAGEALHPTTIKPPASGPPLISPPLLPLRLPPSQGITKRKFAPLMRACMRRPCGQLPRQAARWCPHWASLHLWCLSAASTLSAAQVGQGCGK